MKKSGFLVALSLFAISFSADAQARLEMFLGDDPGVGKGVIYDAANGLNDIVFNLSDKPSGVYLFSTRLQDESGKWTPTLSRVLYISDRDASLKAEYFVDSDPGAGNGVAINGMSGGGGSFMVPTGALATGSHTLTVRSCNESGNWLAGITRTFVVVADGLTIEWFYDNDPGVGKGNRLSGEDGENVIMLPTASLQKGVHTLSIRACDKKFNWTPTVTYPLYVVEREADIVDGEYYLDNDPGEGNGTAFGIDGSGETSFVVSTSELETGLHYLNLRGRTSDGGWVHLHTAPFTVVSVGGVSTVEWKMLFASRREGDKLTLESDNIPSGSVVSVHDFSGVKLSEATWSDTSLPLQLNIERESKAIIITILSPEGIRVSKRILL